ncbi:cadmium-translocating P-type ATPase [Candidatus Bathyarchaeota archaeon]|nr:cadmium-translocating P-type ATPase [Candidatus Bathyarchaeota archaeon]
MLNYLTEKTLLNDSIIIISMLISGYNIFLSGLKSLLRKHVTINLLITIAAIGALLIGHLEEGASVVVLYNLAELLEDYASDQTRKSIKALLKLKPDVVKILRDDREIETSISDTVPGDLFILKPGDRIPLDGKVIEGYSNVDQSAITGESLPITKRIGNDVFAGSLNLDGYLVARATKMAYESTLSRILNLIEEAEESKSPTETFIDNFSRWYTPTIIILSIFFAIIPTFILKLPLVDWVYRSLVMLVVACPCALAISTPVAMVSAITSASRYGVLVKGGSYIELISKTKVVAFDKTGTLTDGKLSVKEVFGSNQEEIISYAASLETRSEHQIASAIIDKAKNLGIILKEPTNFKSYPGKGVIGRIDEKTICVGNQLLMNDIGIPLELQQNNGTVVYVSKENQLIGKITFTDNIRDEAEPTINALKKRKFKIVMLTGDNQITAGNVANNLELDGYYAQLLPEEKVAVIKSINDKVVMVGDGVNDAPALAVADVGIAMGVIGSDVALETADIALLEDKLDRIPYIIDLSNETMTTIKQNIALSIILKFMIIMLTIPGWISLWLAVGLGDMGLTLFVIINSLKLSKIKPF